MTEAGSVVLQQRRYRISGKVQGVFFRASTREQALRLELTGYANNLPDGSVEVLACGATPALDKLAEWLQQGPPRAKVLRVELLERNEAALPLNDFVTG